MRAMVYRGPYKVRVEEKDIPKIEHPNDAIVRVSTGAICGSDLHLYHGMMPDTRVGMTFGHEFVGTVHEVGSSVQNVSVGRPRDGPLQRVLRLLLLLLPRPLLQLPQRQPERDGGGRHLRLLPHVRGYDGGQAEFVRVPFADVGPSKIPDWMDEEDAVLLTDASPPATSAPSSAISPKATPWWCSVQARWACSPPSPAWLMGAGRVIVIDHLEYRLEKARTLRARRDLQLRGVRRHRGAPEEGNRLPGRRRRY